MGAIEKRDEHRALADQSHLLEIAAKMRIESCQKRWHTSRAEALRWATTRQMQERNARGPGERGTRIELRYLVRRNDDQVRIRICHCSVFWICVYLPVLLSFNERPDGTLRDCACLREIIGSVARRGILRFARTQGGLVDRAWRPRGTLWLRERRGKKGICVDL